MAGQLLLTGMQASEGGTSVSTNSVLSTPTWYRWAEQSVGTAAK